MKAKDGNGRESEVFEVGHGVVRDARWRCYTESGKRGENGEHRYVLVGHVSSGSPDRLAVEKCPCELTSFVPGVRIAEDSEDETILESCEICERYQGDEDAAEAFVAALNREAGEEHFITMEGTVELEDEDVEGEEDGDEEGEVDTYYTVALAPEGDKEPVEMTPKAFEARCKMLKIVIGGPKVEAAKSS